MTITKAHLTPNPYSRPETPLRPVKAIVLHWVENPGSTAMANRNWWESLPEYNERPGVKEIWGSAHYIVDGTTILETVPPNEMAYHVAAARSSAPYTKFALDCIGTVANNCTIGIEMCHPTLSGEPTVDTWNTAIELSAQLCVDNNLHAHAITTHHSITRKNCHKWFMDHPYELERFRWDVARELGY